MQTAVSSLVDAAPTTLDTLNELAAALGDDPNFATTVSTQIGAKLDASAYTAADVLTKIKTVDGSTSGLDADLLDGQQGSYYLDWTNVTNKPDPTLTLSGDVSGSATFTDLGNATLSVTVADDSHNHVISNVDGLQSALDGKAPLTGAGTSGTWPISITGNAATVTNGVYTTGNQTVFGVKSFRTDGAGELNQLRIVNNTTAAVVQSAITLGYGSNFYGFRVVNVNNPSSTAAGDFKIQRGQVSSWADSLVISNSNNITITGDIRSPIFYDSNDTSYYINPNGTSNIDVLNNFSVVSGATECGIRYRVNSSDGDFSGRYSNYVALYNGISEAEIKIFDSSYINFNAYGLNSESWRAPIFYDSNNTAYYTDPASTSNLVGLTVANTISGSITGNAATVTNGVYTTGDQTIGGVKTLSGGAIISGSINSGATDYGYYQAAGTNLILKGDSLGRSGIFFESEKDGTTINHPSDYGFIQFHSYGFNGTSGESNKLVIGVANDSDDEVILQSPYNGGVKVGYRNATSGTGLTLQTVLHAGNYNSYSPTLTGGGASGTWGINITGNAGSVTNGVYLSGDQTISGTKYFLRNNSQYSGLTDTAALQAYSTGNNSAFMSFHKSGHYAINMGLDADNVMRIGGWSAPADRWALDMSGNNTVAGSSRAPIFYDSNDTSYYVDPAGNGTRSAYLNGNLWINPKSESYGEGIAFNMPNQNTWGGIRWVRSGAGTNWAFGYFGNESSNDIGFHNGTNGWRLDHSFNCTTNGSFRAPIFYDSNDTGYYLDPASTSRLHTLIVENNTPNDSRLELKSTSTSGYNAIRTFYAGTEQHQIHFFGSTWGTDFTNQSRGAINLSGNGGVTFGGWNSPAGYVDNSGNAGFRGNVTAYAYSDIRLKHNIKPISDAPLSLLKELSGVRYDWDDSFVTRMHGDEDERWCKKHDIGVIAHEVQKVLPEAVVTQDDGYLAVRYEKIIPLLIEAIKEQQGHIEALQKRIEHLEGTDNGSIKETNYV